MLEQITLNRLSRSTRSSDGSLLNPKPSAIPGLLLRSPQFTLRKTSYPFD